MKKYLTVVFMVLCCFGKSQEKPSQKFCLSVSPAVDANNEYNRKIIQTLSFFLESLDPQFWSPEDFVKYKSPYQDLLSMDGGQSGEFSYLPSVMEIIPTEKPTERLVKIAYLGTNDSAKKNVLVKSIYNVIAVHQNQRIIFKRPLEYFTRNWTFHRANNIDYIISPNKKLNQSEIKVQERENEALAKFFGIEPIHFDYYSTTDPRELFHIKGFDYHPMMYVDDSGGFAEDTNIVLSGNNSEYYMHEVAHLYTSKLFPKIDPFLDEGFATFIGGSGKFGYLWQRKQLENFLKDNPDFNIANHLNAYERIYYQKETPVPYVIGALLCERIIRKLGKERLFNLMRSGDSLEEILKSIQLDSSNINAELRNEINEKPIKLL